MSTSASDYRKVAEQTLTNDEPSDSAVVEFTARVFSLADAFSELEADIAEHDLGLWGLSPDGLEHIETRFQNLSERFADIQRVLSYPDTYLAGYVDDELGEDDATRLREAVHSFGDLDRVLDQLRDAQSRLSGEIAAKRNHLTTMRGLVISMVSAGVAVVALLTTIVTNYLQIMYSGI